MRFPNPECQDLYDGWLDYGPDVTGWIQYMNPKRSVEAYKSKQQDRRRLVGQQLDLIIGSCRAKGCIK